MVLSLVRINSTGLSIWILYLPSGCFIEKIGTYDPKTDPSTVLIDKEKAAEWIKKGAKPSNTVEKLFKIVDLKV